MEGEQKVTPLELFFDLVFVFAFTQVTALMAEDPTAGGVGRGMLILAAVWWAWVGYAWLTNALATDEGPIRAAVFTSMAAMLVLSLAVPGTFGDDAVIFGVAYFVVRAVHVLVYWMSTRNEPALHASVVALAPIWLIAPAVLVVAGTTDGSLRYVLWGAALAFDYAGPLFRGVEGWRLHPGHFAERHGLILIIAIGESIVAVGVGAAGLELDAGIVAAGILGIAVSAALWWAYFDVVAPVAERKLVEASGADRNRRARDSFSYLHLPLIAGIVLFALGVKKTVEHTGDPLKLVTAAALSGGVALYFLSHVAIRLRNVRTFNVRRLVTALLLLAFIPAATEMDALAALAVVAAASATLIAYETLRYREARTRIRHPQEAPA